MTKPLEVGRKIYYTGDMANPSGTGCIYTATPVDNPHKSYSLGTGRMVPNDNSMRYDVVLEDGRRMRALGAWQFDPATLGNRFQVRDGIESAETVFALLANAEARDAELKAKGAAVAALFAAAKDAALIAGKAAGLTPKAEFKGRGTAAAYNLRRELKAAGIPVASLRGDHNSINARIAAGATEAQRAKANEIAGKYKAGHFDGMTDCYDYDPSAWGSVFGDVQYVFIEQERPAQQVAA